MGVSMSLEATLEVVAQRLEASLLAQIPGAEVPQQWPTMFWISRKHAEQDFVRARVDVHDAECVVVSLERRHAMKLAKEGEPGIYSGDFVVFAPGDDLLYYLESRRPGKGKHPYDDWMTYTTRLAQRDRAVALVLAVFSCCAA